MPTAPPLDLTARRPAVDAELSTRRLNVLRAGYAFMGVGLAIVKWPALFQNLESVPLMEGVVTCMLTALSLLVFLGLKYPVRMLPVLLFEVAWKAIWIAAVALPHLTAGTLNAGVEELLFSCSFVVVILAVIPWDHVWRHYVRTPGDPWRRRHTGPGTGLQSGRSTT